MRRSFILKKFAIVVGAAIDEIPPKMWPIGPKTHQEEKTSFVTCWPHRHHGNHGDMQ